MSTSRDVEKGVSGEENRALLAARNKGRSDDGERPNRADDMELGDLSSRATTSAKIRPRRKKKRKVPASKPGKKSRFIVTTKDNISDVVKSFTDRDVNVNKSVITEEPEESTDRLQKPWDQNSSLIEAIFKYKNEELISWLKDYIVPNACPISILRAACQAQSNEEALQRLLDAGREPNRFGCLGITPLHFSALTTEPKSIAKILSFLEGLPKEESYVYRRPSFNDLWIAMRTIPLGYTALHVASAAAHTQGVRVLLAAGANPNLRDKSNSTPLDVAGVSSDDDVLSYVKTLQLLRKNGGSVSSVESLALERALRLGSLQALILLLDAGATFDPRNPSGYKLMHLCVELRLQAHLEVLLAHQSSPQMDYRAADVTDEEGSTVLHWAASKGWVEGVTVALLAGADITVENSAGDTALHLAAKAGDFDIVKQILDHDTNGESNLLKENVKREFTFYYAIISGNADILEYMCNLDEDMRHYFYTFKVGDLTPLEYAVEKKFIKLFILIFDKIHKTLLKDEIFRTVNLIAKHNLPELFYELEKRQSKIYSLKKIIANDYILHEAAKHSSREMITVLLKEGADLSKENTDGQTAISLLMHHLTKPTELLTEVLNGCINADKNIYDKDCVIKINYSVLKPENTYEESDSEDDNDNENESESENDIDHDNDYENDNDSDNDDDDHLNTKANDMKVLKSLIETGDVYDQRSLLKHPVVESFLYLKWEKCAKFIYFLISAYVLFLISLNTFIVTIYYHMDHKIKGQDTLFIIKPIVWRVIAICTFIIFLLVDVCFWSSYTTKWRRNKTIWLKLFLIIGGLTMICMPMDTADTDIVRTVAVITVSLSWIYLMISLSWTPTLGYYMQMYGKVSMNVMKVMLSSLFPLVGFSICFMILLRSREPFDDPIAAFLKTMVMMSSEFEYENLVKNITADSPNDAKNWTLDFYLKVYTLRIFFLLFLICVAIVLMNLMLGVAVRDYQDLSHDGQQRRLMKQIECIIALERLFQRRPFNSFKFTETETWKVPPEVEVKPDSKIFGKDIKEIILNKAQSSKETKEKEADDVGMKAKIDFLYNITKKQSDLEKELSEIRKSVNTISESVEKRIDKILEVIANDKKVDSGSGQQN